jgi:hypothetical protein
MISNSDFEKLWFLYKTEGEPKGVSINAFCISRGVNYNEFNKWFRKMHKSIVPVEIEGAPEEEFEESIEVGAEDASKDRRPKKGGIHVFIRTHDGLQIQKKGLNYKELVKLVEKLEGLC